MKFEIERELLATHLGRARDVAGRASTMPVLSNVLVRATQAELGGRLFIGASDLQSTVTAEIPANVMAPGSCMLDAKRIAEIVDSCAGDLVQVEVSPERVADVRCGRPRFSLPTISDHEFPIVHAPGAWLKVNGAVLAECLGKVDFACAKDDTSRPWANGVLLRAAGDGKIVLLASNGSVIVQVLRKSGIQAFGDAIIPKRGAADLASVLAGQKEAFISVTPSEIHARVGSVCVSSKLLEAKWPDVAPIFIGAEARKVIVNREALNAAISRMLIVSPADTGVVLDIDERRMHLESEAAGQGAADEDIPCDCVGTGVVLAVKGQLMKDVIGRMDTEQVEIHYGFGEDAQKIARNEPDRIIVRPAGSENQASAVGTLRLEVYRTNSRTPPAAAA